MLFAAAMLATSGCAIAAFDDPGPGHLGRTSDPALFNVEQGGLLEIDFAAIGYNDFTPEKEHRYRLASTEGTRGTVRTGSYAFWYSAPPDFVGTDTFTYINCPQSSFYTCSPPRTVTITVTPKPAPTVPTTAPEVVITTTTTEPESSTTTTSSTSTTTTTTSTTTSTTAPPPPPPEF